jgi:transcriptional regulator with XRE-family HTH domain
MMNKKEIGQKLKAIRQSKGLSQVAMADFLNGFEMHAVWTKQRISSLERGVGILGLKKAIFLFQCLGIEIEMIFHHENGEKI